MMANISKYSYLRQKKKKDILFIKGFSAQKDCYSRLKSDIQKVYLTKNDGERKSYYSLSEKTGHIM